MEVLDSAKSKHPDKFGFMEFFDFAQSDSVHVGTGLPDGPQILLCKRTVEDARPYAVD